MNKEIRVGVWKRVSQKGTTYCTGKFKIADKEYYLTLFNNDKKGNEKAPDFNLIIRDSVISQENNKSGNMPPKNSEKEGNPMSDETFKQFYVDNLDENIPF